MKNCHQCQSSFEIFPEDRQFYERLQVPEPTFCPDCRFQRRTAYRNERMLYKRPCDLCKKSVITIYSADKSFPVYCVACFWSDHWNPQNFGRDFDFSRPFFEQWRELRDQVPRLALISKNSENCDYTNHASGNRNCYMSMILFGSEDVYFSRKVFFSKLVCDSAYIISHGERLYECFWCFDVFDSRYSVFCRNSSNLQFCYDCRGCTNSFMSSNLRNKKYVFYNQQLTHEDYLKQIQSIDFGSYAVIEKLKADYAQLVQTVLKPALRNEHAENSSGDFLFHTKDCFECYYSHYGENCRYCVEFDLSANNQGIKHCMDCFGFGASEWLYEVNGQANGYNNRFCNLSYDVADSQYLDICYNAKECFACVGLHSQERYCFFNKRYSKEDYEVLTARVMAHMRQTGEYGEFFPIAMSPLGYNETLAQEFFPLLREEVLARGWKWKDPEDKHYQAQIYSISDRIQEVQEDILEAILACTFCGKNYRIIPHELKFYRDLLIPIPRKCLDCRYAARMKLRNSQKHLQAACPRCGKPMVTTTPNPADQNMVCEACYLKEVY